MIIQSHRGAGELSTDNTLEAFELGWALGTIPEADVRTTRDGVLVAFHDNDFSRVVTGANEVWRRKGVADVTWEELSEFEVGLWRGPEFSGHRVPRLEKVWALMQGHAERQLYLDVKDASLAQLAAAVRSAGVDRQVIVASNDYAVLREWTELQPETAQTLYWMGTWGQPDETPLHERFAELRRHDFHGVTQLQVHAALRVPLAEIQRDSIDPFTPSDAFFRAAAAELKARKVLFQSFPWGGASEAVYAKLLDLGVESFATDHPKVTQAAVRTWRPREVVKATS